MRTQSKKSTSTKEYTPTKKPIFLTGFFVGFSKWYVGTLVRYSMRVPVFLNIALWALLPRVTSATKHFLIKSQKKFWDVGKDSLDDHFVDDSEIGLVEKD